MEAPLWHAYKRRIVFAGHDVGVPFGCGEGILPRSLICCKDLGTGSKVFLPTARKNCDRYTYQATHSPSGKHANVDRKQ